MGFIGLNVPSFTAHFTPCVEIGWRLASDYWGFGYATEGARAVLAVAFGELRLREVVALTFHLNVRSRRVMERLGMTRAPSDDFDHPSIPEGGRLRRHVLYRIRRGERAVSLG
jgi:ribosomal-protein-alanine N-acetyltransferase